MTTIINNDERKFVIQSQGYGNTKDIFCNLFDITRILHLEFADSDFIIYEYWNRRLKKCTKKHLNEMFAAHSINFKIK